MRRILIAVAVLGCIASPAQAETLAEQLYKPTVITWQGVDPMKSHGSLRRLASFDYDLRAYELPAARFIANDGSSLNIGIVRIRESRQFVSVSSFESPYRQRLCAGIRMKWWI